MKRIFNKDMTALAALSTKGCYIYASLTALSRAKVRDFLVANLMDTELEFLKLSDTTELHVTLMYSNRNPWESLEAAVASLPKFAPVPGLLTGAQCFGDQGQVAVFNVESQALEQLHAKLQQYLTWDSEYAWKPHCTVAKTNPDKSTLRLFTAVVNRLNKQLLVNPIAVEFDFVAPDILKG